MDVLLKVVNGLRDSKSDRPFGVEKKVRVTGPSRQRRRYASAVVGLLVGVLAFAPGSPAVQHAKADIAPVDFHCFVADYGARYNNTTAQGWGHLTCSGQIGQSNMTLQLQHCFVDFLDVCATWQNVNPIMGYRSELGVGNFWLPTTGVLLQGGLTSGGLYRLVMYTQAQSSGTGIWYYDLLWTPQWRQ